MSGVSRWAAIGFGLYVALGIASLFAVATFEGAIFGPFGIDVAAGTVGLSLRNGLYYVVWGLAVALAAVPIGRRLVPAVRFDRPVAAFVLVCGALLAGVSEFLVNEWVRDRFGYFDPEYVGFAGFAPAATLAQALAAWAALSVPRGSRSALLGVLLAAVGSLALALLPSLPGVVDGIDPASIPVVTVLLIDGAFAAVAVVLARR